MPADAGGCRRAKCPFRRTPFVRAPDASRTVEGVAQVQPLLARPSLPLSTASLLFQKHLVGYSLVGYLLYMGPAAVSDDVNPTPPTLLGAARIQAGHSAVIIRSALALR